MTTKLEELRAAFEASSEYSLGFNDSNMLDFAHLAHNNMSTLLEVVERLESMQRVIGELASTNPFLIGEFEKNKTVLEKLK